MVIGAGQAGLAMSAVLQQHCRWQVALEREELGGRWRTECWDSRRFQFPIWSLQLPGYAYGGDDPNGFAHWREILCAIEDYAASILAPVHEHTEVTGLLAVDGAFALSLPHGHDPRATSSSRPGPFQRPRIPQLCGDVPGPCWERSLGGPRK